MQLHHELPLLPVLSDCALTVGTFDGVHRGHHALVELLRREAATRSLQTAVLTFTDMPYCYFRPDNCPCLLTLPDEKIAVFKQLAIDHLFIVPFSESLAAQSAEKFVSETLVHCAGMKLLIAGPDFALGRGREGDIPTLRTLGEWFGFDLVVLADKLLDEGEAISSTRTRECVERGDVATAARLLGRPFALSGGVVSGQQLGRTIGVPTINLRPHARKVVPANGVYAARAFFDDKAMPHLAALNIGSRPTVGGDNLSIEFHVIGENIPRPPQTARLEIIERLRDEQKFPSLEALVAQMQRDIARATQILQTA